MRLSKGEVFFGLILFCIVTLAWPHSHFATLARTIQGNHHQLWGEIPSLESRVEPIEQLAALINEKPVHLHQWTVTAKGILSQHEGKEWERRLVENGFNLRLAEKKETIVPSQLVVLRSFTKQAPGSPQIIMYTDPGHSDGQIHFIFTWSGQTPVDNKWLSVLKADLKDYFADLQQIPEIYACFEAIGNARLKNGLLNLDELQSWLTDDLKATLVHQVTEDRFISLNGYVHNWNPILYSSQHQPINVQLSARYNMLDQTTRITLGYPLILKAH